MKKNYKTITKEQSVLDYYFNKTGKKRFYTKEYSTPRKKHAYLFNKWVKENPQEIRDIIIGEILKS